MHTLGGGRGVSVRVVDAGAALASVRVPDRHGTPGEVVLGFDRPDQYLDNPNHFGSTVGRYAGRIARGRFRLEGRSVQLPLNLGGHHLHGGPGGFSHRRWHTSGATRGDEGAPEITFTLHSPDGEQGYPGAVDVGVTYRLEEPARIRIRLRATADAPTHLSLTNHTYFNLAGRGDVARHLLRLAANRYLPLDPEAIPTGELAPVTGTSWDFTREKPLLRDRPAYDHCFAVDGWEAPGRLRECAWVRDPDSGRTLSVATTLPGIQLYTPDFGPGTPGRGPDGYRGRAGFCLETQFFPDAPNRPHFPSTRLDPGQVWEHETVLTFGAA